VRHAWAQYQTESAAPEFGLRLAGQTYVPRPGSYALLFNEQGQIAVMETPRGGFLPGGGAEAGETPEEALRREVREECGFEIGNISPLGEAVQYVYTPGNEAGIRKDCTFFEAQVSAADGMATERGHVLLWRTPAEAERSLAHESQTWAVCKSRRES
jgi:8-oxo-dGTP diphosphatase